MVYIDCSVGRPQAAGTVWHQHLGQLLFDLVTRYGTPVIRDSELGMERVQGQLYDHKTGVRLTKTEKFKEFLKIPLTQVEPENENSKTCKII